ncbi:unnamed protein product [Caenorhabditis sp. 36 PRJEB53466]|nr:unnamed protein product [Caenorhabditis sp. 36 PRJEB53466]
MQQELWLLTVTFPCLVSFVLVSCLKTPWKFKGDHSQAEQVEIYVCTVPETMPKKVENRKRIEKNIKKPEKKEKKDKKPTKNLAKFFIFNAKDEDLKTPISTVLSPESTQNGWNSEDDEHESPMGPYEFSDEERLGAVRILPTPPAEYVSRLKTKVRKARRGKKSPQDYPCADDEDSLFNVASLSNDPATVQSSKSIIPLNIQDSRVLRMDRFKKSHAIYSPITTNTSTSNSSGTDTDLTITGV